VQELTYTVQMAVSKRRTGREPNKTFFLTATSSAIHNQVL